MTDALKIESPDDRFSRIGEGLGESITWIVDVTEANNLKRGERIEVPATTEEEARALALELTPEHLNHVAYIIDAAEPQVPPIVATVQSGAFDNIATELRDALTARIEDPAVVTD